MGCIQSRSKKSKKSKEKEMITMDGMKTIEDLPLRVLAICLSYTAGELPKAMLTCRRFRDAAEEYAHMMNVIPAKSIRIAKEFAGVDSFRIHVCQPRFLSFLKIIYWCRAEEARHYIRFYRPESLIIVGFHRVEDLKNKLTNSWKNSITNVTIIGRMNLPMMSIFPNIKEILYNPEGNTGPAMAEICANVPSIQHLRFENHTGENDSSLDLLTNKSNNSCHGIKSLGMIGSTVSIHAVIRFLEKANFADGVFLVMTVKDYIIKTFNNGIGFDYRRGPAYDEFKTWLYIQESNGLLQLPPQMTDNSVNLTHFRYRNKAINVVLFGEGMTYAIMEEQFIF